MTLDELKRAVAKEDADEEEYGPEEAEEEYDEESVAADLSNALSLLDAALIQLGSLGNAHGRVVTAHRAAEAKNLALEMVAFLSGFDQGEADVEDDSSYSC